jgi:hypothetical protein
VFDRNYRAQVLAAGRLVESLIAEISLIKDPSEVSDFDGGNLVLAFAWTASGWRSACRTQSLSGFSETKLKAWFPPGAPWETRFST